MSKVYGETFMSDSKVRKWCRNFDAGHTVVHDAGGQGRKPVSTDDLVQRVDQAIRGNRRFTISGLSDLFPEISRSALYTIVSERLEYRKLCARWVPKMLSNHHKTQRMGAALTSSVTITTEMSFWTKLSQEMRLGSIMKLKKRKGNPNSACIRTPRVVNQ
ncbi:hypothetical protein AVEN_185615-1 [Araneus ventricosus]|uniref:Mos1 transposase HTH domain-containing protein n=1 Tax=Araneus ventricosus TaxID=182803 RepID=A0A4Y2JRL9_ARAVE|nr:hypothetical protein AVEN_233007-1 [Araneus ventricosus]GBM92586.1 hypothetical protein AVEN_60153-1 [Araneus ventricosus]GBM92590.1 hypothetical protein AVEN_82360-1 [Araneus ventricosus]GBM92614.1 hypothetical protein AVEN_185615-1 [Araneus ventricosus]